jgi:hypothetical protein
MMMDPAKERARLSDFYANKTDEELAEIAGQSQELTDVAGEVLRNEIAKRQLSAGKIESPTTANEEDFEFRDLVTIRSYWGLLEAEMARGLLESAGIEAFLFDDNMVRMDWFNANALGGVKLRVDADNVDAANRVFEEAAEKAAAETDSEDAESAT